MANEKNLIPNSQRTPEELREMTRKGGIKSGQVRRQRKTLKEELLLMLSDENVQQSITTALIQQAQKGNVKAYETIRDSIGEKEIEKVLNQNVEVKYEDYIKKMEDKDEY